MRLVEKAVVSGRQLRFQKQRQKKKNDLRVEETSNPIKDYSD